MDKVRGVLLPAFDVGLGVLRDALGDAREGACERLWRCPLLRRGLRDATSPLVHLL